MYFHIVVGTGSYTTSTTNMYNKHRFHVQQPLAQRSVRHTQHQRQYRRQRTTPRKDPFLGRRVESCPAGETLSVGEMSVGEIVILKMMRNVIMRKKHG